ncbi:hypothetical protein L7F22_053202 [Adiantum nelumboides]|nr:hypothetical protein [Adiantum nelumboides]
MNELSAMLTRRQEVLAQLEAAHIKLAKNVMAAVGKRTSKMRSKKRDEGKGGMGGVGGGELNGKALKAEAKLSNQFKGSDDTKNTAETEEYSNNQDVEKEAVEKSRKQLEEEALEDLTRRLARFSPNNKGRHGREAQMRGDEVEDEMNVMAETVWESLATVPRELLDPYQPATRLSALFRGQTVPTVDYLLTKLNLLTALVTEMRARPPSSYEPTSTAFVTFRDPRQARMVWRELKSQIVVRVRLAPEVKDLDWERLMRTSFTGDLARGLGVNAFFWGLTIFWIIPIQLLTSVLFSVKNLKLVFPPVESFFQANPGVEAFVSVTLPTVLVSLITMAVPEIIFQISKRAQGFVTFSALYDQCLCRYWKFIICNVVIFFCIGVTTIETILQQVVISGDLLLTIAFSFPAAAPFYVSYLILGISLHSGFELFGFMVPLIQHLGARKAFTPRARALKTLPRNFNRYYWLPFHTLIATIVFIFAILNPLVIPFALVYIFVAMIVFKKNFAYVYFRRFNEKDGVVYFTRLLRFSLDGLLIGQIVIVVFFAVTNQRAVYIGMSALLTPFTVAFKLFGTRLWASQSRALDDDEANALCGISVNYAPANGTEDQTPGSHFSTGSRSDGSPLDARARGRYPTVLPAPSTGSAFYRVWHRVHDSFNANGHDKSSYVATAHARGQQLANPVQFGAKSLASAPMGVVKETAGNVSHFKNAITLTFGRNKNYEKKEQPEEVAAREVEEAVVASQDLPMMAAAGDAEFKEEKEIKKQASKEDVSNLRAKSQRRRPSRRGSSRSESRPFLSGADAVLMNAPVEHDAGDMSFNYGDEAGYEARMARTPSGTPRRPSRRGSAYQSPPRLGTTESGYLSDEKGRRLSEFGHLVPAHESEELKAAAAEDAANQESALEDEEEEDEDAHRDLVCPHANVRWDDTPSNSARYNNPFYNTELDPFLWLPRDPSGYVGEWDEEDEEESEFAEKGQFDDGSDDDGGLDAIHGDEQILLTGSLARHLEEVEDVEDVPDPAASLPRAVLADYKKAIRRGSQMDDSQEDSSTFAGNNTLTRHESVLSHSSFRSPTLSARMRVDGDGDRPPSPIDLRSSPTNALRPVSSNDRDQDKLRRKSTKRKDTAGSIPAFDLSSPTDQQHSAPIPEASSSPISPTPASAPPAPALHFDEAKVAGHDHKASTQGPSRPSNLLPPSTEQRVFSSPAAGVSFQTPTQGLERNTAGGSSHFRYGTGASGMSGASLKSGVTSLGRNRTISMKKALQAEVMEEERRLLLKEKLGTVKRKTALLKGTTQKMENEQSEALQRGE